MREIKFRAWIKNRQQMDMVDCLELRKNVNVKYIHTRLHGLKLKPFEVELMQYTGLKDCKGCKIYEGDIISHPNDFLDGGVIKFINGLFVIYKDGIDDLLFYHRDLIEVIGNIYQHKDLLK